MYLQNPFIEAPSLVLIEKLRERARAKRKRERGRKRGFYYEELAHIIMEAGELCDLYCL